MLFVTGFLGALGMAFCQWLIYAWAPTEAAMGLAQKIFYIHLPLSWWALISFFCGFYRFHSLSSAQESRLGIGLAAVAAEVGLLFCGLALVTGCLWAKRSWGVWWTWDPRLTTTIVLWFVYAGYLVLRGLEMGSARKRLTCAVVGIVAFLDVPLVFISARIWRSIHPAVFASREGGLPLEMKICAICCVAAMGFIWWTIVCLRKRQLEQIHAVDSLLFAPEN